MLVHKGGQINNVPLITGLRIAEMSQLQNCSVMCTKNGSYYEKREKKSDGRWGCVQRMEVIVKRKKSQGGQGRCERRSEAFVKIIIFFFLLLFFLFFFGGGGGRVGGSGWM